MGWFDEDEDEDENKKDMERTKPQQLCTSRPMFLTLEDIDDDKADSGAPAHLHSHSRAANNNTNTDQDQDQDQTAEKEEKEDPLDAYMKGLAASSCSSAKPAASRSERLDVENEDEATSHWQTTDHNDDENEDEKGGLLPSGSTDCIATNEASRALQQTFHKASSGTNNSSTDRRVNIQLDQVHHASSTTTAKSSPIRKCLFPTPAQSTSQGHAWRTEHSISCHPPLDPIYSFAELRDTVPKAVMEWIYQQPGMTKPTLVQSQTWSVALTGHDAIVTASTGSGKTLAYLLPAVTHLVEHNHPHPLHSSFSQWTTTTTTTKSRALVLVPTRELALQVETVAKRLLSKLPTTPTALTALAITGGNMGRYQLSQTLMRQKPHLIVATPGRLLDVLSAQQKSKHQWLLQEITYLVLDEADKMLQLGFASQVTQILQNLRPDRQSLLTSATMTPRLEQQCQRRWMQSPTRIRVGRTGQSSEHVQQHVLCLPSRAAKIAFLQESLSTFTDVGRTLVFCATRDGCEALAQILSSDAHTSTSMNTTTNPNAVPALQTLHGDKHPTDRQAALKAFAKGKLKLLIATDVAGRGLDIPEVTTVINYDPAKNWDTHVHRIGRAGRLSAAAVAVAERDGGDGSLQRHEGTAYTLLTPTNVEFARTLVQAYEREGRTVTAEIRQLALSGGGRHQRGGDSGGGNYSGGGGGSSSFSRGAGLGYYGPGSTSRSDDASAFGSTGNDENTSRKKSRWS